jgi:hypothetical protein
LGIIRMILETDSLELVKIWNDLSIGRSIISSVCREIRELSGFFTSFELVHVKRSANKAAHLCAHKASPERRRCVSVNYIPIFLVSILAKDCNTVE